MTRRWIVMMTLTALALVAGCGGGGDGGSDDSAAPTRATTPAPLPAGYSPDDLSAALPTAADLPAGLTLSRTCPEAGKGCEMYPDGLVVAEIDAEPASPVGAEQVRDQATPLDFVSVQGQTYADAQAAAGAIGETRENLARFVGAYDVKQDAGRTSRGEGALRELRIGAWSGLAHQRTEVSSDADTDQGLLVAMSSLSSGTNRVAAFVSLSAAERDPDAAADLADSLVREYIERLES